MQRLKLALKILFGGTPKWYMLDEGLEDQYIAVKTPACGRYPATFLVMIGCVNRSEAEEILDNAATVMARRELIE